MIIIIIITITISNNNNNNSNNNNNNNILPKTEKNNGVKAPCSMFITRQK